MSAQVCIDASLALQWLLPSERGSAADALMRRWQGEGVELIGPPLFDAEVTSVLREQVYLRRLTADEGERAFQTYELLGVRVIGHRALQRRAWELAARFNERRAHDMQYVALADLLDCALWTSDRRLVNAVRPGLPWVKSPEDAPG